MKIYFFSIISGFLKENCFLEGSQATLTCPGKSSISVKTSMGDRWKDTDRRKLKQSEKGLFG
jgi:hypothetical protein